MPDLSSRSKASATIESLPKRIALMATVPSTLKAFYQPLIEALNKLGRKPMLIAAPGEELDWFAQRDLAIVRPVPITRTISPLSDLGGIIRLVRLFRRESIDLLHTHTPKAGLLGMIAGKLAGIAHRVHTLHGLPLETATGLKRRLLLGADRATCRAADVVCIVSQSLQQRANELRLLDPAKQTILGEGTACGIDLPRFSRTPKLLQGAAEWRARHGISPEAKVIGFIGWMVADKGVSDLVQVFDSIASSRDDVYLLMIGADGGVRDPLPQATQRIIHDHPRIFHDGLVDDPTPYYAAMDVCVLPTRREGFPYALLEAGAMEVPVVATRVTGCVDAVVDGETGLLVELGDTEALRGAIERLIDDAALGERMGKAARRRVEAKFDSRRLVKAHLDLYRRLACGDGVAGRVQSA